jgi:hypothetical protein
VFAPEANGCIRLTRHRANRIRADAEPDGSTAPHVAGCTYEFVKRVARKHLLVGPWAPRTDGFPSAEIRVVIRHGSGCFPSSMHTYPVRRREAVPSRPNSPVTSTSRPRVDSFAIPLIMLEFMLVSRIFVSWNQLHGWLRQIETLRRAA